MRFKIFTALACLLCFGGCTKDTPDHTIKESSPQPSSSKLTNENAGKIIPFEESQHFTEEELKVAVIVRDYVEVMVRKKFDARYAIEKNAKGWVVTVYYVGVYRDGKPSFAPGRSAGYQVSETSWKVEGIYPGL